MVAFKNSSRIKANSSFCTFRFSKSEHQTSHKHTPYQHITRISSTQPFAHFVFMPIHGFENLFYYNSKKMGEVDFVTEYNGNVFPIEVKSGKDYVRHKALNNILECEEYTIPEALVLCNDNLSIEGDIKYLPIYMIMFIYKEKPANVQFSLDLSGLS